MAVRLEMGPSGTSCPKPGRSVRACGAAVPPMGLNCAHWWWCLAGKVVGDIGCANGYFMYRMLCGKPKLVIGIDPSMKAWLEFQAFQRFTANPRLHFVVGLSDVLEHPPFARAFDVMFCLGVLYHTPDPIGMLRQLWNAMAPGGTLIVDCQGIADDFDGQPVALFPSGRYANCTGMWFLPTLGALKHWLKRSCFNKIECFYAESLSTEEQRATKDAPIGSLAEGLRPDGKTAEGYPPPVRYYVKARRA